MRVYVDFGYYRDAFFGDVVPEVEFLWIARRASRELDRMCAGRIGQVTEDIQDACCAICDVLFEGVERGGEEIARVLRERVQDVDVTYQAQEAGSLRQRMLSAASVYLWHTGLLSIAAPYVERG